MDKLRNYDVAFAGLKNGKHKFQFKIDSAFFELFETEQEFTHPDITADVLLDKHSTFLELEIDTAGTVELICDITNEPFRHPVDNGIKVLVKFGEVYDDTDIEVITIPAGDHAFNVAQLIYENVVLAIPMKKVSPDVKDEDLEMLEKFSPKATEETAPDEQEDPRWAALKKLKDNN